MPSTVIFVPFPFAAPRLGCQEPKAVPDQPSGAPAGPAPAPGQPGTAAPGQPQAPAGAAPSFFDSPILLMLMVFVVVMLFTSMRRDSKARKAQAAMLAAIKQGDRVVTTSGMHGTVHRLDERTVSLRVDSVVVTFDRAAIARVERDGGTAAEVKKA